MQRPGSSCCSTLERSTLPTIWPAGLEQVLAGGRLGLLTHSTAGFIAGLLRHITLELSNVANLPITLCPGMKIGQLCLPG